MSGFGDRARSGRPAGRWKAARPYRRAAPWPALAAATLFLALPACGNLTAGGASETEVLVSGNGPEAEGGSAAASAFEGDPGALLRPSAALATEPAIQGNVTVEIRVFLVGADGSSVDVAQGTRQVTVDVRGEQPQTLGTVTVPPGSYTGAFLSFTRAEANVIDGLEIGGISIRGVVEVDFGEAESLVVERPISVTLDDGDGVELTVHLRSPVWLELTDPETLLVPAEGFRSAVEVESRARTL